MTSNAPVAPAAHDATMTGELRSRFESDAIPHMRQMFSAAYRLTQDRCDAEDLIQETFARAYVKFDKFEPGTNLRAWLYCIMFRTFCSTRRKRARQPAEVLADDLPIGQAVDNQRGIALPSRSAEAEALDCISDSVVMRALAELPPQFKTALYLADIHGYHQSDIADIMGTPVGTVVSRLHRGRAMLRARLRQSVTVGSARRQQAPIQSPTGPEPTEPALPAPIPEDAPMAA